MGYCTYYTLTVHEGDLTIGDILESVGENFPGLNGAIDNEGYCLDSVQWYEHEDDMRTLSQTFPSIVFSLYGEGEETEDLWYKYFKNGKMQECYVTITFDAYDPKKLE